MDLSNSSSGEAATEEEKELEDKKMKDSRKQRPGGLEPLSTTGPAETEIHQTTSSSRASWMIGVDCQPSSQMWRLLFFLLYHAYLAYAIYFHIMVAQKDQWDWCEGLGFLLIITALFYLGLSLHYVSQRIRRRRSKWLSKWWPQIQSFDRYYSRQKSRYCIYFLLLSSVAIFLALDTSADRRRLISAGGILLWVLVLALFSKHPSQIDWRQVTWGLSLQFIFALLILRWSGGRDFFACLGDKVDRFLAFTNEGSGFVFGYLVHQKIFNTDTLNNNSLAYNVSQEINASKSVPSVVVFSSLSVIYFFSFIVNILFYLGIVQWITSRIGWVLSMTIGTSTVESMNAASNIFIGQAMAPLLIKPYLSQISVSEIHAILTSGFSTIAGTVMAAYINFGVSPAHLLSASVMSAPAALAAAKLLLPETDQGEEEYDEEDGERRRRPSSSFQMSSMTENCGNLLDAATQGASSAALLVINITAIVVAFIAFVAFLNAVVGFFGGLIGFPDTTFESLLGYAFVPVAFILGVDWSECHSVGTLLGIKTVANEFIAYRRLGLLIESGGLSARASTIATYALCGFANPGSVGVQLATLTSLCPQRKAEVASVMGRAFVAGTVASFFTAGIAGALLDSP